MFDWLFLAVCPKMQCSVNTFTSKDIIKHQLFTKHICDASQLCRHFKPTLGLAHFASPSPWGRPWGWYLGMTAAPSSTAALSPGLNVYVGAHLVFDSLVLFHLLSYLRSCSKFGRQHCHRWPWPTTPHLRACVSFLYPHTLGDLVLVCPAVLIELVIFVFDML